MVTNEPAPCKRPYALEKRRQASDGKRLAILQAARSQLESNGFLQLTMDSLARESGVTRQTIHNLFGTKASVLEALFDQIASDGGLGRMRHVMQMSNTESMLTGFVEIFTGFWAKDRLLIRRIHGIAAIDPEFGAVVQARNRRRGMAATRIVTQLAGNQIEHASGRQNTIAALVALTSFEFFDALAENLDDLQQTSEQVLTLVKKVLGPIL